MYDIFFFLSSVEKHLGYLQFPAIMNKSVMNTVEQMSLWYDRTIFEYMPRSGLIVDWFLFWKTKQNKKIPSILFSKVTLQVCTLPSSGGEFSFVPYPWQHEQLILVLILAILTGIILESFDLYYPEG